MTRPSARRLHAAACAGLAAALFAASIARADDPPDAGADPGDASAPGVAADPGAGSDPLDAGADPPVDPGAPPAASAREVVASCVENVPSGAARPELVEVFPERGLSGYAATLEITVKHGKGETVLPEGLKVQTASDAGRALAASGFVLPDPDGGSPPALVREEAGGAATTKITIPFVPLPAEPGRHEMTLPPVPIAVARASGELVTVCTKPHRIRVEDPTANEPDPKVKPNAPPRRQREDWEAARKVAIGAAIGAALTVIALVLWRYWRRRPRVVKGPPPKLPWVVALEELAEIRRSPLLAEGQAGEHYDRVSNTVRKYLGARYGFDGLEATTDEMRSYLYRVRPPIKGIGEIMRFLEECDLVKFARVVPTDKECLDVLERGEAVVHMTIPPAAAARAPSGGRPPAEEEDE